VRNIADIVSKGGNYLLNVGPTAEGEIPAEGIDILKKVGAWTTLNAAAIYGAGPTPFGAELGYEDATKKDREGKPVWVDRNDWRCTTQPGKLFFTLLTKPTGSLSLPSFPNKILRAYLTSAPRDELAVLVKPGSATLVNVPTAAFGDLPPVLCLEIEGRVAPATAGAKFDAKKDKDS
jgi:alpha-L-fucosidase